MEPPSFALFDLETKRERKDRRAKRTPEVTAGTTYFGLRLINRPVYETKLSFLRDDLRLIVELLKIRWKKEAVFTHEFVVEVDLSTAVVRPLDGH